MAGRRPAPEDLLGTGALVCDLPAHGAGPLSVETTAAKAAYAGTADITGAVAAGASGQGPASTDFTEDVAIATARDVCAVAPVRNCDGAFAPGGASRHQTPGSPVGQPVVRHSCQPSGGSPCRVLCAASAPARSACTGMAG